MKLKVLKERKERTKRPFPAMILILVLVFIVLLAASFVVIGKGARINFENQSHKELMQLRKNMKLEFELGFKEQIALAVQMAKSPLIVK